MSLQNYEIVKELGRGGMGAVFLANDKRLKRQVAIKVLKLPLNLSSDIKAETINNFKREAVAIANLSHNNIVCVYDIGNQDDIHYIVMELIDGATLSKLLSHQGHPFSLEKVLKISDEICDALSYVHKNKVIHRDIKPENIIYTSKEISKLTDFGIAKFAGDEQLIVNHNPGDVKGTILYISPEQLQSPDYVDGRADMYSFAVSMYELLTGRLPFHGETPREVIMKILTEEPIPPSKIVTDLLPHIDPVILKALAKDPEKRYANIDEFKNELKSIGEYRARFAIQPMKNATKTETVYYSQISIESFEDVVKYSKMLPESGQQRLLYQIEMIFSKFLEEYKDQISKDVADVEEEAREEEKKQNKSGFLESLTYVIPKVAPTGMDALKSLSVPMELILFLSKVNGSNSFMQILESSYNMNKLSELFNLMYNASQKNLVNLNITPNNVENTSLLGDMLVSLGVITQPQLDFILNKKKQFATTYGSKFTGEMLVEANYITRDKLLHVLKLQHWYRRLFS